MNNHIKEQKEQKEQTITSVSSPLPHKEGQRDKFTPIKATRSTLRTVPPITAKSVQTDNPMAMVCSSQLQGIA